MYSPKQDDPSDVDNQGTIKLDPDSITRCYALIETNPDDLEHIIDLLRQFFPKTKIIEYNNPNVSVHLSATQQQTTIEPTGSPHLPITSNTNSQVIK